MKQYLLISTLFITGFSFAQTPEEGLRTAWFTQTGTARNMAIGGAMGSLGGDISANHINPAGLGVYKTSEFVLSLGAVKNNNEFSFRGTENSNDKGIMRYGAMGFVLGAANPYKKENVKSFAFSFSVNQLASYNNRISFKGFNNYSSFSEQYIEELARDKADTNAALSNYIYGSTLAFRTYLVDTLNDATGKFIGYKSLVPISTGVNQDYNALTRGGYHEIAFGFATNVKDKWYFGGSLAIPLVSYQRQLDYSETDATNNPNNNFAYFNYKESLKSFGVGLGLKLGAIYKPAASWRLGLAIHTPQVIGFKDKIRASMTTNTETLKGIKTETSDDLNDNNAGERKYTITTPYRVIGSASYVFSESENTKKQRGFLSADVEFVNYRGARFSRSDEYGNAVKGYYKTLNNTVKDIYKGNVNFKVGGELKFDPIAVRVGAAYYGSPYNDTEIKGDKFVLSGGVGYRKNGIFIDLAVSQTVINDAQFPYRLNDVSNTYATQTGNAQNVMLTVGFKL
jgi:hypothetical protein